MVVERRTSPDVLLVNVIAAFGTTEPVGSETVPVIVPNMDWACALEGAKHAKEPTISKLLRNRSLKDMEARPLLTKFGMDEFLPVTGNISTLGTVPIDTWRYMGLPTPLNAR